MQLNCSPSRKASAGFTLLEVLVALIVLSIGLLGLSGLQTSSLRNNHSAFLRSQATVLSADIMDRMRANRDAATGGDYDLNYAGSPTAVSCSTNCSSQAVASMDLTGWRSYVERLPGGESEINVTGAGIVTVRVRWADTRDSNNKLEVVTRTQI